MSEYVDFVGYAEGELGSDSISVFGGSGVNSVFRGYLGSDSFVLDIYYSYYSRGYFFSSYLDWYIVGGDYTFGDSDSRLAKLKKEAYNRVIEDRVNCRVSYLRGRRACRIANRRKKK